MGRKFTKQILQKTLKKLHSIQTNVQIRISSVK